MSLKQEKPLNRFGEEELASAEDFGLEGDPSFLLFGTLGLACEKGIWSDGATPFKVAKAPLDTGSKYQPTYTMRYEEYLRSRGIL